MPPFSYVDTILRLRDASKVHPDEAASVGQGSKPLQHLVKYSQCLTPHPLPYLEKTLFTNNPRKQIADESVWQVLSQIVTSTENLSVSFVTQLVVSISSNVRSHPTARSTLRCLLQTQHLRHADLTEPLIDLLRTLLSAPAPSPSDDATAVLDVLLTTFAHLRDHKAAQAGALALVSQLAPQKHLHSYLSTFVQYLTSDYSAQGDIPGDSVFNQLDVVHLAEIFPFLPTNLQGASSAPLVYLCLQNINSELKQVSPQDVDQRTRTCNLLQAISMCFSFALSHHVRFSSKVSADGDHKRSKKNHPVERIFEAVVLLFSKVANNHNSDNQQNHLILTLTNSISTMLQVPDFTFDRTVPLLLNTCAVFCSSKGPSSPVSTVPVDLFLAMFDSYLADRRLSLFFKHLSKTDSSKRVLFGRLGAVFKSLPVKVQMSRGLSMLPRGSASSCVFSLVPLSKELLPGEKNCLSLLISLILESTSEKDLESLLKSISHRIVPLLGEPKKSNKCPPLIFLLSSALLVATRDNQLQYNNIISFVEEILNLTGANKTQKNKKQKLNDVKRVNEFITDISETILHVETTNLDIETTEEKYTVIRLLCVFIRVLAENKNWSNGSKQKKIAFKWLNTIVTQSIALCTDPKNEMNITKKSTSVFINGQVSDDVLFMVFSLSDIVDSIIESEDLDEDFVASTSGLMKHCIKKWNERNELWSELFEKAFVRRFLSDALCILLQELKADLKSTENTGTREDQDNRDIQAVLKFILQVPVSCFSQKQVNSVSKKLNSLKKLVVCDNTKQLLSTTLFCLNDGCGERLLEWDEGWDNLDNIEGRIEMCKNMMEWGERSSSMVPLMINFIVKHFDELHQICFTVIATKSIEHAEHRQVLRIGLNIQTLNGLLKTSAVINKVEQWLEKSKEMKQLLQYTLDHIGWYCVFAKGQKQMEWIQFMVEQSKDLLEVSEKLKACRHNGKNILFHIQLAAFCILTKPWSIDSTQSFNTLDILRHMLSIGLDQMDKVDVEEAWRLAGMCIQCCEIALHRVESSDHITSVGDVVCSNVHKFVEVMSQLSTSNVQADNVTEFSTRTVSCIVFLLRNQRATHYSSWSIAGMFSSFVTLAVSLSRNSQCAQGLGQLVANVLTTVDWCFEQSEVSKEIVKFVILTTSQCLCGGSAHANFEVPVLDGLACLLRTLPKGTVSVLISTASAPVVEMLQNISQLANRIEYEGQ